MSETVNNASWSAPHVASPSQGLFRQILDTAARVFGKGNVEQVGTAVLRGATEAAEVVGPRLARAGAIALEVPEVALLALSGDTADQGRFAAPTAHAMSVPSAKPSTQVRSGAATTSNTACPASPEDLDFSAKFKRNEDPTLPKDLRTSTGSARLTAYNQDPTMLASGLKRFGPADATNAPGQCAYWEAHHLLSVAQVQNRRNEDIFGPAAKAGWTIDEKANLIGLPRDRNAQIMLHDTGLPDADRPIHNSSHQGKYKDAVERAIERIRSELEESRLAKGSLGYNQFARTQLEKEQVKLKGLVLSHGMDRLTETDRPQTVQEASAANPWQQLAAAHAGTPSNATSPYTAVAHQDATQALWFHSVGMSPPDIASTEPTVTRSRGLRLG